MLPTWDQCPCGLHQGCSSPETSWAASNGKAMARRGWCRVPPAPPLPIPVPQALPATGPAGMGLVHASWCSPRQPGELAVCMQMFAAAWQRWELWGLQGQQKQEANQRLWEGREPRKQPGLEVGVGRLSQMDGMREAGGEWKVQQPKWGGRRDGRDRDEGPLPGGPQKATAGLFRSGKAEGAGQGELRAQ